jgi:hypothetical protein
MEVKLLLLVLAVNGFPLRLSQADFDGPGHRTESQVPGAAANSQ